MDVVPSGLLNWWRIKTQALFNGHCAVVWQWDLFSIYTFSKDCKLFENASAVRNGWTQIPFWLCSCCRGAEQEEPSGAGAGGSTGSVGFAQHRGTSSHLQPGAEPPAEISEWPLSLLWLCGQRMLTHISSFHCVCWSHNSCNSSPGHLSS